MKSIVIAGLAAIAISASAHAESPLWLRNPSVSPDGKNVAFTYHGDIFIVDVNGGNARQLTSNSAYDSAPVWSPDGTKIAFLSNRDGSDDIYITNAQGGTPRRLTRHSGAESPLAFVNDSILLIAANFMPERTSAHAPFFNQTYQINVNLDEPRIEPFKSISMRSASVNADGKVLYTDQKGLENMFRKHETSSSTADIWMIDGKNIKKLTDFSGHDQSAVWAPDGESFYYISEKDGTLNVYKRTAAGSDVQLTRFTEHPVRNLSVSADGRLVFSWDGELYSMTESSSPKKIEVAITADDYDRDNVKNIRTYGATTMAVSPSGDEVAFIIRGDVYVTSTKYKTTRRITDTPGQERNVSFSADGRTLVYDSERDGKWQLFTSTIKNPAEDQFAYATEIEESPLYSCATTAQQPLFSPNGKYVAFLEDRTALRVIDVKSKKVNTALDGKYNYSYTDGDISFSWSPDSKWLLADYIGVGGWNNSDIALVSRDGKEVVDLTESGYSDGNAKWALNGRAIVYSTGKYGMKAHGSWGNQSDAVLMVLDPEAWDEFNMTDEEIALAEKKEKKDKEEKAKKEADKKDSKKDSKASKKKNDKKTKEAKPAPEKIELSQFDIDGRTYRTRRLTRSSSMLGDYFLNKKGSKFYYIAASTEGGRNLYVHDLKKDETKLLCKGVSGGIETDKNADNIYVISGSGMKKITLSDGSTKPIEFEAFYDRTPSKEREYIYDHMLSQVKAKFYDVNMHGVDWEKYGEHYRKFLPYINNNRDFSILLSEILGELNASHTGAGYYGSGASLSTPELGAYFDNNYKGDGLKIAEIIKGGPLSPANLKIKVGDVITAIDHKPIEKGRDYYPLLEGKSNRKTLITVKGADGAEREINIRPVPASTIRNLVYRRWVDHNEKVVDSISGGRIGYVHVAAMDGQSFQTVYDRLLGHHRNKEAVVVDTRFNGGGWLHNDLAILLSGKEYVRYTPRGRYIGSDPFSQWTKPSVMLVNESNYSDAHGSSYTYQTLGIGDVVGAPVPGTMTAVWWETQIDPQIVFGIPQVTSQSVKTGKAMENCQLTPDVLIYGNPELEAEGRDVQLEGATKHLLNKLSK